MTDQDYEIGYGRPPKHTRFKPGQSGNPRGRRPAKDAIIENAARVLSEPVTARDTAGRARQLKMLEASYLQLCKKALNGERAALLDVMRTLLLVGPGIDEENEAWEREVEEARASLYQKLGLTDEVIAGLDKKRSTSRR